MIHYKHVIVTSYSPGDIHVKVLLAAKTPNAALLYAVFRLHILVGIDPLVYAIVTPDVVAVVTKVELAAVFHTAISLFEEIVLAEYSALIYELSRQILDKNGIARSNQKAPDG